MLTADKESPPGDTAGFGDAQVDGVRGHYGVAGHGVDAQVSEGGELVVPLNGWPNKKEKYRCLWRLVGEVTRDPRLSKGDVAVLYAIAQHVNDDNIAWPQLDTLAARTGVNRSTVIRSVDRLVRHGYQFMNSERFRYGDMKASEKALREAYELATDHVMRGGAYPEEPVAAIAHAPAPPRELNRPGFPGGSFP